jgi:chemotaxis protein MotB
VKKKKQHGGGHAEHDNSERWLLTYSDVVTLLLALFVYLFSISTVNVAKFRQFGEAFAEFFTFGGRPTLSENTGGAGAGSVGSMPLPGTARANEGSLMRDRGRPDAPFTGGNADEEGEKQKLAQLRAEISGEMKELVTRGALSVFERDGDLVLRLRDIELFEAGESDIRKHSKVILLALASHLLNLPNEIRVEGHTDNISSRGGRYRSNWELSAARAASIVSFFEHQGGLAPSRLSLSGFGDQRPVAVNYPRLGNPLNRRVEIVILARKRIAPGAIEGDGVGYGRATQPEDEAAPR